MQEIHTEQIVRGNRQKGYQIQGPNPKNIKHSGARFTPTYLCLSDAVPSVLLAEWDLHTDYFDGATISGPVPRLFASHPDEARTALRSDAAKAFKDLQRIHSRLFIAENIPASEAWGFVGNPRQGNVTKKRRGGGRGVSLKEKPSLHH